MENKESNNQKYLIAIIALAVGLLLSLGYIFYAQSEHEKELQNITNSSETQITDVKLEKERLNSELLSLQDQYNQLQDESYQKDDLIAQKDGEIANKQEEIRRILSNSNASEEDLRRAQQLVRELKSQIASYKEEIEELRAENGTLRSKNDTLRRVKDSLETGLKQERLENNERKKIIGVASTLKAANFSITGIKTKSSGKEVETSRSNKVSKLRVSFDLDENRVSTSEEKELFIRVTLPNGNIAMFDENRSGVIELQSGEIARYSDKVTVYYTQGTKVPVSFDWEGESFEKGNYKFTVFQNGFKIGEETKTLK
ncbi:MAG: hypothetical protein H6604_02160 [Flavobacteriales bacterium]|nr:hypothetical protein [Flavobacteriales bacterium]